MIPRKPKPAARSLGSIRDRLCQALAHETKHGLDEGLGFGVILVVNRYVGFRGWGGYMGCIGFGVRRGQGLGVNVSNRQRFFRVALQQHK